MDSAIYDCPIEWDRFLPPGTRRIQRAGELTEHIWPLLALTPEGCRALAEAEYGGIVCRLLLAPGDLQVLPPPLQAETVISYGLSPRTGESLTPRNFPSRPFSAHRNHCSPCWGSGCCRCH